MTLVLFHKCQVRAVRGIMHTIFVCTSLLVIMSMLKCPGFSTAVTAPRITLNIGVVSSSPTSAQYLAGAVEAAIEDGSAKPHVTVAPVSYGEPLDVPAQVCAMANQGVSAIVADGEPHELRLAAAAAARAGVPLLIGAPLSMTPPAENLSTWEAMYMYPQPDIFIQACADLCKEKGWQSAVLLHENPKGARLVQEISEFGAKSGTEIKIRARILPPPEDEEGLRTLLLILKKDEHTQFIVWCDEECCDRVLSAAQRVGLLSEKHGYILLALDLHTLDLEPYSYGGANITSLQLFDPEEEASLVEKWTNTTIDRLRAAVRRARNDADVEKTLTDLEDDAIGKVPQTKLLLTYDVVRNAAIAMGRLKLPLARNKPDSRTCGPDSSHVHADTLINYLRSEKWVGKAGARRSGHLRVVELSRGGSLDKVGQWDPQRHVTWSRPPTEYSPPPPGLMANQTFTVLISLSKPYVMMKEASDRLTGNERYEGFGIELIDKLSKLLNFNYTLVEQRGGTYDDMLNSVRNGEVHFAITDLTITAKREKDVDFTTPFMNLGISILYKKPSAPVPKLFAFMLPFSTGVWFCLGLAYVGTSLVLYVVGRVCPEEWQNPYPCIEEPEALENQFTIANALWFTLGAVLCQGSEIAPVAYGSRAVASAWWIFALVITSSYTANLATLLAKKNSNIDFADVTELANNQMGITYGAKINGSTYLFFRDSQDELFKKMFENMLQWDMPASNDDGIKKVLNTDEKFAFLMESTSIEYNVERICNLTQVGGLLDSKGYGIAMQKESAYRQSLNLALLNLQEAGELRTMKKRWWKELNGGGACNDVDEYENAKLTMTNFLGLFLVLGIGCVLGLFISLADLMLAAHRKPRDPTVSYWHRLKDELRFVFHFQLSEKPVEGPLLPPPTPKSESLTAEPLEEQELEEERMDESRLRSASFQSSGVRSRRRSSIHNASVRLRRHARQSDAATPARNRGTDS